MVDLIEEVVEGVEKAVEAGEELLEGKAKRKPRKKKEEASEELIKEAEAESLDTSETDEIKAEEESKSIEERKKELLEKAKKLSEKIDTTTTEDLKEKVKAKKKTDMLVPLEEYVKSGIYLGTKVVTPGMRKFVYRRRADGLAIFNTDIIDEKLKEAIDFLSGFDAKEVVLVCKRQAGWKAAEMFSQITGIRVFAKKYPAGILTNTSLENFFENELTIISDAWIDKNALNDTLNVKKKVLMICDTNNFPKGATQIIIGNNKSAKSLGLIFYLLARGYCKAKGIEANFPDLEIWMSGEDSEE